MNRSLAIIRDIAFGAITSVLAISLSGFLTLADAATSCNDIWYTTYAGVQYKYSDKLDTFTSYRGKTYAYAKGGTSGSQEKISSGLTNGKALMYGMQSYISNSYPGASIPVVSDGSMQQMLKDVFGPAIKASAQTGIYIGELNKNDGNGYVNMDGSGPATFYNWVLGEPNPGDTCKDKTGTTVKDPYVFMLPDGTWKTVCDGTAAPLFVFDGVFDCATPYTGTGSVTGTGPTNIPTGPVGSLKQCDATNYEGFVLKENTTYAITKQPMTWAAAKSLANSSIGKLAYIGSQATNDFLTTSFGPLMGGSTNVTGNKAWIGLYDPASVASWCMPGTVPCPTMPSRFQWTNDVTSFSNWAAGQPDNYCTAGEMAVNIDRICFGENWAALGADGKWYDEGDHGYSPQTTLKAIVQWQDQMSCTTTITPPPPPPGTTTLDTSLGLFCTDSRKEQLKNCVTTDTPTPIPPRTSCQSGYTMSADGTSCNASAPCPNNLCSVSVTYTCPDWATLDSSKMCVPALNLMCPIEQVLCTDVFEKPSCPDNGVLEPNRHMCQLPPTVVCPSGYTWDKSIDRCVADIQCSEGGIYNSSTQKCEKVATSVCDPGGTIVGTQCITPAICPLGGAFGPDNRCWITPTYTCSAPDYIYNSVSRRCELDPLCPPGSTYSVANQRCEEVPGNCPQGYSYNPTTKTCTAIPSCGAGTFNPVSNSCEMPGSPVCNPGWTYNSATLRCEQSPVCESPSIYDSVSKLCLAPISGATCPTNYVFDAASGACLEQPACTSGSLVNGRCEAAPTCPLPGFAFNAATGRCEQAPGNCPSGFTYNGSYDACVAAPTCSNGGVLNNVSNLCELQVTTSCSSGWTFDSVSGKCTRPPACLAPGSFDSVKRVCSAAVTSVQCPTNYTWDSAKSLCVEAPICASGTYSAANGRCESVPTCSGSDLFNAATGRCEKVPDGCEPGYTYSATLDKCVAAPSCPGGTYDPSGVCKAAATPTCASGTLNATTGKCEQAPFCNSPGVYSATADKCIMDPAVGCQPGYTYNSTLGVCTQPPQCLSGTVYSSTLKTCQAPSSYVCSDASYTYNSAKGRCEKAPVCSGGATYNSTYNLCQLQMTPSCGPGYNFNATRNRCEKIPECPPGTSYSSTANRCETPPVCPPATTFNSTSGLCEGSGTPTTVVEIGNVYYCDDVEAGTPMGLRSSDISADGFVQCSLMGLSTIKTDVFDMAIPGAVTELGQQVYASTSDQAFQNAFAASWVPSALFWIGDYWIWANPSAGACGLDQSNLIGSSIQVPLTGNMMGWNPYYPSTLSGMYYRAPVLGVRADRSLTQTSDWVSGSPFWYCGGSIAYNFTSQRVVASATFAARSGTPAYTCPTGSVLQGNVCVQKVSPICNTGVLPGKM